jgi:hypothetical protein
MMIIVYGMIDLIGDAIDYLEYLFYRFLQFIGMIP